MFVATIDRLKDSTEVLINYIIKGIEVFRIFCNFSYDGVMVGVYTIIDIKNAYSKSF